MYHSHGTTGTGTGTGDEVGRYWQYRRLRELEPFVRVHAVFQNHLFPLRQAAL